MAPLGLPVRTVATGTTYTTTLVEYIIYTVPYTTGWSCLAPAAVRGGCARLVRYTLCGIQNQILAPTEHSCRFCTFSTVKNPPHQGLQQAYKQL